MVTFMGNGLKLVDKMKGSVNVAWLQETKWKGDKTKELTDENKLYHLELFHMWSRNSSRKGYERKGYKRRRLGNRFTAIKLVLEEDIIHIISAYTPKAGPKC